jgi:sec-independent protein translocase protein TatA
MFTGLESPTHLIIVLVIVLLVFGGKRVPELAKGLGTGVREFKKSFESGFEEHEDERARLKGRAGEGPPKDADNRDERKSQGRD